MSDIPSHRKRLSPNSDISAPPPNADIWSPLLLHIQSHHPMFASQLLATATSHLLASTGEDPSFDMCTNSWLLWMVETWGDENVEAGRADAVSLLLGGLGSDDNAEELNTVER